jgi:hypothetical protein
MKCPSLRAARALAADRRRTRGARAAILRCHLRSPQGFSIETGVRRGIDVVMAGRPRRQRQRLRLRVPRAPSRPGRRGHGRGARGARPPTAHGPTLGSHSVPRIEGGTRVRQRSLFSAGKDSVVLFSCRVPGRLSVFGGTSFILSPAQGGGRGWGGRQRRGRLSRLRAPVRVQQGRLLSAPSRGG